MQLLKDILTPAVNYWGDDKVRENVEYCMTLGLPEVFMYPAHSGVLDIVGGAPSLASQLDKLKIRKSPIWAINGSAPYLARQGIMPTAMVILESSASVSRWIEDLPIKYLIASQADKEVFDKLHGKNVVVWHAIVGAEEENIISRYRDEYLLIGGGCSAVLRCLSLGYAFGFREFNMFGFDCAVKDTHHAYEQKSDDEIEQIELTFNGERYTTAAHLARQAQDFVDMVSFFNDGINEGRLEPISITLHGEGLAQDIAKHMGLPVVN